MDYFDNCVNRAKEGEKIAKGKLADLFIEGKLTFEEWSIICNSLTDVIVLVKTIKECKQ